LEIHCDAFSGSLGVLLESVRRQNVDLLDIPITPICEAYLLYLVDHAEADFESAAAAMVALAYLLERKAWALLPRPSPEPEAPDVEPASALMAGSEEWAMAVETLRALHDERQTWFFRTSDPGRVYESPLILEDDSLNALAQAFARVLERSAPVEPPVLARPRRSLGEQLIVVHAGLDHEWRGLDTLISSSCTREDAVWWFLALLELVRVGRARVRLEGEVAFSLA
jgi:segregation and condensation protein A